MMPKEKFQKPKHEDFRRDGYLSLWLGTLASEDALLDYLAEELEAYFGFEIYPPDGPEYDVSVEGFKPIGQLIQGFSRWNSFVDAAVIVAVAKGWETATTALVFYDFKFINRNNSGRITFIGEVPFKHAPM